MSYVWSFTVGLLDSGLTYSWELISFKESSHLMIIDFKFSMYHAKLSINDSWCSLFF